MPAVAVAAGQQDEPKREWHTEESYSANDMISAYEKGVDDGGDAVKHEFRKEVEQIQESAEQFIAVLADLVDDNFDLNPRVAYIAPSRVPFMFKAITVLPAEEFASEEALKAISWVKDQLGATGELGFTLSHMFMPDSDEIDQKQLTADGFTRWYYVQEQTDA